MGHPSSGTGGRKWVKGIVLLEVLGLRVGKSGKNRCAGRSLYKGCKPNAQIPLYLAMELNRDVRPVDHVGVVLSDTSVSALRSGIHFGSEFQLFNRPYISRCIRLRIVEVPKPLGHFSQHS